MKKIMAVLSVAMLVFTMPATATYTKHMPDKDNHAKAKDWLSQLDDEERIIEIKDFFGEALESASMLWTQREQLKNREKKGKSDWRSEWQAKRDRLYNHWDGSDWDRYDKASDHDGKNQQQDGWKGKKGGGGKGWSEGRDWEDLKDFVRIAKHKHNHKWQKRYPYWKKHWKRWIKHGKYRPGYPKPPKVVPLPASSMLFATGIGLIALARRRNLLPTAK